MRMLIKKITRRIHRHCHEKPFLHVKYHLVQTFHVSLLLLLNIMYVNRILIIIFYIYIYRYKLYNNKLIDRYAISYILLALLFYTAILQIKYLNKAMQRYDSTAVIPTQFVLFTLSAIAGSAVIYRDFDDDDPAHLARYIISHAPIY